MMAFDVLPTHKHNPTARRSATRPPLPRPRNPLNRAGIAGVLLVAVSLAGLGLGSAALAESSPELGTPKQEQMSHSRTGCLTPSCTA